MSPRKGSGENLPMTVTWAPASIGESTLTRRALLWNSGKMSRQWSSRVIVMRSTICAAIARRLPWSSITPLGLPVEPLV